MRWVTDAIVLTTLTICLAGCGAGGPAVGMPTEVPKGAPPVPPGTTKEMMKGQPRK